MSALLPHHRPPWVWPASLAGGALLLVVAMLVPASWWWLLIPDRELRHDQEAPAMLALQLMEEVVLPPPALVEEVMDIEEPEEEPVLVDPQWWTHAWEARLESHHTYTTLLPDSLVPTPLLDIYGAQATLDLILAAPDSLVQANLWQLVQEESLSRNDLNGLFSAIARARSYADMKQREAAMFDEFMFETVPVTK